VPTVSSARKCASSWFHAFEPATANAWVPKCVAEELTMRSPRVADRSLCLLPTDVTGRQRSAIYGGARPWSVSNTVSLLLCRSLTAVHGGPSLSATGRCGRYILHTSAWTGPTISSCSGCRRTWQGASVLTRMTSCSQLFRIYLTQSSVSVSSALVWQHVTWCNSGGTIIILALYNL